MMNSSRNARSEQLEPTLFGWDRLEVPYSFEPKSNWLQDRYASGDPLGEGVELSKQVNYHAPGDGTGTAVHV